MIERNKIICVDISLYVLYVCLYLYLYIYIYIYINIYIYMYTHIYIYYIYIYIYIYVYVCIYIEREVCISCFSLCLGIPTYIFYLHIVSVFIGGSLDCILYFQICYHCIVINISLFHIFQNVHVLR